MKNIRILIILLLGITQNVFCQWILYTPYNTKGIQGTMVSSGLVAQNGLLWFGTDKGVTSMNQDNALWTTYNTTNGLNSNFIYQVFEDKSGDIWAATNGAGVSRYSGNGWTNYSMKEGLSYNVVRAITQSPDGTLWFGTYGHGICSYKPAIGFKKNPAEAIASSYVLSLLAFSDNLLLIGTLNEGLVILENDTIRSLQNENALSGKKIFYIFRDHTDRLWIGTDKGAQRYDPSTRKVLACPDSLSGRPVYSICENPSGELVFTSDNKIYTVTNGSWSSFVPDNLLSEATFYSAFYDKEGNGWFGTTNQGLFKKSDLSWYNYFNSSGLSTTYFTGMCEDRDHNMWFSCYESIYRFDGQNWNNVTQKEGIVNKGFKKIVADVNGNIWCTSYYGLYKYDGNTWTNYSSAVYFEGGYPSSLIFDKEGILWVCTYYNGVYRYDGTNWTHFAANEGMTINYNTDMEIFPDGRLAVVSEYGEIAIYDGNIWTIDYSLGNSHYIYDMTIDKESNIWLATNNGILKHKGTETQSFFASSEGGYYYSYVEFITLDKNGNVWAGLYYTGLLLFNGTDWQTFSTSDGLSSNYLQGMMMDSRGRYWVFAENGINRSDNLTGINEPQQVDPGKITVYPNPFSSSFDMLYSSAIDGVADICIYSAEGRMIKTYNRQKIEIGENTIHFTSLENWPDGLLFCKITMNGSIQNIKLIKVSTY
jgi:ligand-binding sensor domain-containing protein